MEIIIELLILYLKKRPEEFDEISSIIAEKFSFPLLSMGVIQENF